MVRSISSCAVWNKSEKYWSKLAERGVISNYTPVEDVDLENVQVDTIVED